VPKLPNEEAPKSVKVKSFRPAVAISIAQQSVTSLPRPGINCTMEEVQWGIPGILVKVRDQDGRVTQAVKIGAANIQQIDYEKE